MASHIIDHFGHLGIAQLDRAENELIRRYAERRHSVLAGEHGHRHVLPRDQRRVAGQFWIMPRTNGPLSLRHVAALTYMSVDFRAAGVTDAGAREEKNGIIGAGTCGRAGGYQQRREAAHLDATE